MDKNHEYEENRRNHTMPRNCNWWSVSIEIDVNGESMTFDELPSDTQEHIINCIKTGCECGSLE